MVRLSRFGGAVGGSAGEWLGEFMVADRLAVRWRKR
jgi:hypothetical protein